MTASRNRGSHRPRRSHTLGGCRTCRRRHVKCDQNRPVCQTCSALGIRCEGFSDEVRWMRSSGGGDRNGIRRQLYTEQSRRSMTTSLGTDLVSGSVDASIAEIDTRSRDNERSSASDVVVGPFAVLNFAPPPSRAQPRVEETGSEPVAPDMTCAAAPLDTVTATEMELEPVPPTVDGLNIMDDFLHWSDLLGLTTDPIDYSTQLNVDVDPIFGPYPPAPALDNRICDPSSDIDLSLAIAPDDRGQEIQFATPQLTATESTATRVDVLADAQFLFKHFQDKLIPQMMVMPLGDKCPWKILNLPSAVMTFSHITFLCSRNISNAQSANLYGVLACAAIHLTLKPATDAGSVDHWSRVSSQAFDQAKDHMQLSLKHETRVPKKSKYKDQMMAICVLTQFAIISGQQEYARCFMVDAERVLRARGLPKRRISQKVRLLHHVYTWLRIVGESTYLLHDYAPSSSFLEALRTNFRAHRSFSTEECDAALVGDPNPRLDDFLRLETRQSDNDLNIDEPKDQESGLHDIHLQDSRSFSETMYKQIYGIPETWLSLVSQTARLANVMESFRVARRSGNDGVTLDAWETLRQRSVRLESMICSFSLHHTRQGKDETSCPPHGYMVQALDASLVIYLYRRIGNIHPVALEGHVDNVIGALAKFHEALPQDDLTGPGTAWPAFIAGCEALTPTRREAITRWLDNAESMSGFAAFKTAKSIMSKLWARQDEQLKMNRGDPIPTWVDLVKKEQIWPLFC